MTRSSYDAHEALRAAALRPPAAWTRPSVQRRPQHWLAKLLAFRLIK